MPIRDGLIYGITAETAPKARLYEARGRVSRKQGRNSKFKGQIDGVDLELAKGNTKGFKSPGGEGYINCV